MSAYVVFDTFFYLSLIDMSLCTCGKRSSCSFDGVLLLRSSVFLQ